MTRRRSRSQAAQTQRPRSKRSLKASLQRAPLGARLLVASLVLVLVLLPLAGAGLTYNFRQSATASFDSRLESQLNALLAGIRVDSVGQQLQLNRSLGDARFERVYSGWYWQVSDGADLSLASRSLWDQRLPMPQHEEGVNVYEVTGPRHETLRMIERDIQLPGDANAVHVALAGSTHELDREVGRFERLLIVSLATFGVLLLGGLALQMRWGLAPLRRMSANLRAVEEGEAERLDTELPAELKEVALAMNSVLERDRRLIERGRAAAGNLAHALKTPVSVLKTQAERFPPEQRKPIHTELSRIDEAVRHHLARASAAGGAAFSGRIAIARTIEPVVQGLSRLAQRRGLRFHADIDPDAMARIDPQDLQELTGNLLENALRWAAHEVRLTVKSAEHGANLRIEDDGPGMTRAQSEAALARGVRLDARGPGSGLGLAIVEDLMALYGGSLRLDRAALGGLLADVWLPVSPVSPHAVLPPSRSDPPPRHSD
ncbi:sensor histidine kinase [Salinicola rhizosphaerae]|uniref:histidine kinase n=1 Tax=Salinicola rhizosphaerae TaxID=1443141 RepID=A0ABQ3E1E6_9GAMM|nr:HAMP domain-containing sensor histidine kinase [Salinicola rhizosphaerae]GHB21786.1 ATPase [Salinicola rhizosphaerae]